MINQIKKWILKPPYVRWCSQTIYECLLGAIKIYKYTKSDYWKNECKELINIQFQIQQPDGGFDIGYDFNFGFLHKKGESTSPELLGLLAYVEYANCFGSTLEIQERSEKAANWICKNAIACKNGYYIPYAPASTKDVMVYNGTSFACGALGAFIGYYNPDDKKFLEIYKGFIQYLSSALVFEKGFSGKSWPYYDQERKDLNPEIFDKIDYFHQMQQVEAHCIAQLYCPNQEQLKIIQLASNNILDLYEANGYIPYTNKKELFGGNIHLWGFSSIISGLIHAEKQVQLEKQKVEAVLKFCYDFIMESYNNKNNMFFPIMSPNGTIVYDTYMVRSDAWVFNSLSNFLEENKDYINSDELLNALTKVFAKMKNQNFSGLESHASTAKTRLISKAICLIKK